MDRRNTFTYRIGRVARTNNLFFYGAHSINKYSNKSNIPFLDIRWIFVEDLWVVPKPNHQNITFERVLQCRPRLPRKSWPFPLYIAPVFKFFYYSRTPFTERLTLPKRHCSAVTMKLIRNFHVWKKVPNNKMGKKFACLVNIFPRCWKKLHLPLPHN